MSAFETKTVLVTGGSSGIGLAAARAFAAAGARVAVTGRDAERLAAAADALGPSAVAITADVATAEGRATLAETVARELGGLDAVFLNAGIARFAPIEAVDEASLDALFDVNVKGVLLTLQGLLPHLREGAGVVVNTSVNNAIGMPGSAGYAASKAAARSLVRVMAAELAPRGIRVNAVSPGPVETPIYGKLGLPDDKLQEFAGSLRGRIPLGRFGDPAEIARAVVFLAGPDASFVTGSELVADGGWTQIAA